MPPSSAYVFRALSGMRSRRLLLLFTDDKGGPKVPEQVLTASVRTPVRCWVFDFTIGCGLYVLFCLHGYVLSVLT